MNQERIEKMLFFVRTNDVLGLQKLQLIKEEANYQDKYGYTALMATNNPKVVKIFIKAGANLDLQNICGETALSWAIGWGYTEMEKIIKKAIAEKQEKNNY